MESQLNVRFSREDFDSLNNAARTHNMTLTQYCRTALLAARDRSLAPDAAPFFEAVTRLLGHVPNDLANLHRDFKDARTCDAGVLAEIGIRTLATLEEVQGLRTLLVNAVGLLGHGQLFAEGDFEELKSTATRIKARNAQRVLTALTTRLHAATPPETPTETPTETQAETPTETPTETPAQPPTDTPRRQDHTHA